MRKTLRWPAGLFVAATVVIFIAVVSSLPADPPDELWTDGYHVAASPGGSDIAGMSGAFSTFPRFTGAADYSTDGFFLIPNKTWIDRFLHDLRIIPPARSVRAAIRYVWAEGVQETERGTWRRCERAK